MGWFSGKSGMSDAERSLVALQQGGPTAGAEEGGDDWVELFVTLRETPATRSPGTRLAVVNQGTVASVGQEVLLHNTFSEHATRIVAMYRDGQPVDTLGSDEEGDVVLDDATDLSEVYRVSALVSLSDAGTDDYAFMMLVHSAEQRGKDAYVVGAATGSTNKGEVVIVAPWDEDDPDSRAPHVRSVESLADGRTALLLAKRDASVMQYGDEVCVL